MVRIMSRIIKIVECCDHKYQTNEYSDDESFEWYIEVNDVVDGVHEPIDTTFSPVNDEGCLMVQIAWCIERFW